METYITSECPVRSNSKLSCYRLKDNRNAGPELFFWYGVIGKIKCEAIGEALERFDKGEREKYKGDSLARYRVKEPTPRRNHVVFYIYDEVIQADVFVQIGADAQARCDIAANALNKLNHGKD